MNIKLISIILFLNSLLFSIEITDNERVINLELSDLNKFEKVEIATHRNKDGENINDNWVGVKLIDILTEYNITDFDKLSFASSDNYLVRVYKKELLNSTSILALERNNKILDADQIRLVVPHMRDMFWIQGISNIRTETIANIPFPHTIYFAEPIIQNTQIKTELPPFVEVTGYTFPEIMVQAFPFLKDEVLVVGKDGVKHNLNFAKYLKNAVLIKTNDSYDLRSPDMPAGMWIKDIAYIQIFDIAVVFKDHFESLSHVNELLNWKTFPSNVILHYDETKIMQSSVTYFNSTTWSKAKWLEW
ncbi:MAG: molybdopterin-dependent oxidoreductase [Candidatus Tenebribacter davisii]|nr:molybdopterin-dependent oxidoreductase [Candidatus Tenebribacter davisii]